MTFVPHTKNKRCFTACPEHKIKSGLCDCVNRMKFKCNDNIVAVSGECVHDYKLNTLKNDILCTKCGLSKYLD